MSRPILNYTTQVNVEKTLVEIQQILVKHGAHKVVTDYKDGLPCAVTFALTMDGRQIAYALPANYSGVLNAMKTGKVPLRYCNKEQALRVSWRIIKDWVEAQMAIVQASVVTMDEVFLPYAITKNGTTLYHELKNNSTLLLGS